MCIRDSSEQALDRRGGDMTFDDVALDERGVTGAQRVRHAMAPLDRREVIGIHGLHPEAVRA